MAKKSETTVSTNEKTKSKGREMSFETIFSKGPETTGIGSGGDDSGSGARRSRSDVSTEYNITKDDNEAEQQELQPTTTNRNIRTD